MVTVKMPSNPRDYLSAIEALNKLQTRTHGNASKDVDKLKEMTKYLYRCGMSLEQLDELHVIHVTGTHGKGSTCAYTENILRNHGYKTGFYSSPHLLEVRERIRIDGRPISKGDFADNFWSLYDMLDSQKENENDMPLYFRFLTLFAFYIFLKNKVDVAIIEVGIGGQYDCTNIVRKTIVAGITPINIDHTALLGTSIESIAWHKAGIVKEGCDVFSVEQPEDALRVIKERCQERRCCLTVRGNCQFFENISSKIPQHVRRTNASLATSLSQAYMDRVHGNNGTKQFSLELAIRSIESTFWPGRYQIKQVKGIRFFLDGAHTVESIRTCSNWFKDKTTGSDKKRVLIFNLTGKRDAALFLKELIGCQFDITVFIPNVGHTKETADTADFKLTTDTQIKLCEEYRQVWLELEENCSKKSETAVFTSFAQALNFLDNQNEYDTLVTGSLYLVGAALSVLDPTLNGTLSE